MAFETFPSSRTDSGVGATVYLPHFDVCNESTLLQLLADVYAGRVTSMHFGTPCRSWSTVYQICGPGVKSKTRWWGSAYNTVEILGNRTVGATVLLMRAFTKWEVLLHWSINWVTRIRGLKCFRAIMGWDGVQHSWVDQCEFGLTPGDAPSKRYLKPTYILDLSLQPFGPKLCLAGHEHVKIEGGYRLHGKIIRRSTEAGAYPWRLARALAELRGGI